MFTLGPLRTGFSDGGVPGVALASSDTDRSSLHYGRLACCFEGVELITADGERIDARLSADRRVWAVADPSPRSFGSFGEVPPGTIVYVEADGTEVEVPTASLR